MVTMGMAPADEEAEDAPAEPADEADAATDDAALAAEDAALAAEDATLDAEASADEATLEAEADLDEASEASDEPALPEVGLYIVVLLTVVSLPSLLVETIGLVVTGVSPECPAAPMVDVMVLLPEVMVVMVDAEALARAALQ
jgi:hypothetical protein